MYIIYLISRKKDGRSYVGITRQSLKARLAQHIREDENGIGAAIRRAGRNSFEVCVLEECEPCQADTLERHYINALNALEPRGYNRKPGGDGHKPSKRLRARITKAKKRPLVEYPIDDLDYAKAKQTYFDAMIIAEEI